MVDKFSICQADKRDSARKMNWKNTEKTSFPEM